MGLFERKDAVEAFRDLLEKERRFILTGNIEGAEGLTREKTRLIGRIATTGADVEALMSLRRKAGHNNRLLEASAKGFKAVEDQLRNLTSASVSLNTYGSDGHRSPLGRGGPDVDKKA